MKTINRRRFLKAVGAATAALALPDLLFAEQTPSERPNILFCISDDQSWLHTSAYYGCKGLNTPGFDRVARMGVLLTHAFCSAPACAPSRAAVLTGQDFWRLKDAACHFSNFPKELFVYQDALKEAGYHVGFTGKGWGPGSWEDGGRKTNPTGKRYDDIKLKEKPELYVSNVDYAENFKAFLKKRGKGQPFSFWYSASEPHRPYVKGSGLKAGKKIEDVVVPPFLPDTPEVRSEILDYFLEIEWFDAHLVKMLDHLEEIGELDNTIIVVTSDNGMPFPRAKSNLYDYGSRMPFAICWPKKAKGGRVVHDMINLTDCAPTFLAAASLNIPPQMTGKSLMNILLSDKSGIVDKSRDSVVIGKERHAWVQPNGEIYPMRGIRTHEYLYIRNFKPHMWPAGHPDGRYNYDLKPFGDADGTGAACKMLMIEYGQSDNEKKRWFFDTAFGKRPAEELYCVKDDPAQLNNLADKNEFRQIKLQMSKRLDDYLTRTEDPRFLGRGEVFENYVFYWSHGAETGGKPLRKWEDLQGKKRKQTKK